MKFLIMNCHTYNRGDEAANKALIKELNKRFGNPEITLAMRGDGYPNLPSNVKSIMQYAPISKKRKIEYALFRFSSFKIAMSKTLKVFVEEVKTADVILHSPGGPSIGDQYLATEKSYLISYEIALAFKKPYHFFAPSMGPFRISTNDKLRRRVLCGAASLIVRDPISKRYLHEFLPEIHVVQTLDSAFQSDIDLSYFDSILNSFQELREFLKTHEKVIGVTITELEWHPVLSKEHKIKDKVINSLHAFIDYAVKNGYAILFIPQLFGVQNDSFLMKQYCKNEQDFFVMPDNDPLYDSEFQQYLISKLFCVVGMRYHSNIFSAKMGTPFISISYEQKMSGFMESMSLMDYCIAIDDLGPDILLSKFDLMIQTYDSYKKILIENHDVMSKLSRLTMDIIEHKIKETV